MPCSTIGKPGLHTVTTISSGCPDERQPVIRMGCRRRGNQSQSANKYTKPYIFFFLHFLVGRVKRDLGVHKLVIGDDDGKEQKPEKGQTAEGRCRRRPGADSGCSPAALSRERVSERQHRRNLRVGPREKTD